MEIATIYTQVVLPDEPTGYGIGTLSRIRGSRLRLR
jgi:hypothetical protein